MTLAIQIRYLPATNTKDYRLKAFTKRFSITLSCSSLALLSDDEQREFIVKALMKHMGWDTYQKITGFGALPCGDYVATLGNLK